MYLYGMVIGAALSYGHSKLWPGDSAEKRLAFGVFSAIVGGVLRALIS